MRTYHESRPAALKTGTFYFGGNRNFLLWSDSWAARDDDSGSLSKTQKPKKGSRPLRGLLIFIFQDHLVLESDPALRIILGLENAVGGPEWVSDKK
jgi:hypothetical protein